MCLALGLVFESLGIPVADDVETHRDADPDDGDPRGRNSWRSTDCNGVPCQFGCCVTINGNDECRELDC
nr:conotoxin precursor H [Conus ebraeus]